MIFDNSEQGSDEWLQARCGVVTASNFDCIITPGGKHTTGAKSETYMNQLLAEWHAGKPVDPMEPTLWMRRGTEMEPEARSLYEFIKDVEVEEKGLCYLDDRKLIGASVDGLVNPDGQLEIKCPKGSTLIGYIMNGVLPSSYKPQVQGQLLVTGREWCDFLAYHPDFDPFLITVQRDERYIKALKELLDDFVDEMLTKREKLKEMGEAA